VDSARDPFEAHRGRPPEASVFGFKDDDDARRFGLVRPQARQSLIAPAGKADNFTGLTFHFRRVGRLQDVKAVPVEKERMIPKQVVQLGNRGMAIGKNLGIELAQGLLQLCRVQFHGLLLFLHSAGPGVSSPGRESQFTAQPALLPICHLLEMIAPGDRSRTGWNFPGRFSRH
jgi:hypothetical protein